MTQTLKDMGINNPQEIIGFTLLTVGKKDVLRINYKRKKGSLLPVSKRFSFPRQSKLVPSNGSQELIEEISPLLTRAIDDLDSLLKNKHDKTSLKSQLHEEIDNLEAETKARIAKIKEMIENI